MVYLGIKRVVVYTLTQFSVKFEGNKLSESVNLL